MRLDQDLTSIPNPAPLPNKASAAKKVSLNAKTVEATHVAGRVNPPQMKIGRKDFELNSLIKHIVIRIAALTISGSAALLHFDLLHCHGAPLTFGLGAISGDLGRRDQKRLLIGRPARKIV